MNLLLVGAMETELSGIKEAFKFDVPTQLGSFYPLWSKTIDKEDLKINVLQTYVGSLHAVSAMSACLYSFKPDLVIKVGCVGTREKTIHRGDFVISAFHCNAGTWRTKSESGKPSASFNSWSSLFGDQDDQVSRDNLGGLPFFFRSDSYAKAKIITGLKAKKIACHETVVGSADIWYHGEEAVKHVKLNSLKLIGKNDVPPDRWIFDMESYALAWSCHIYSIPFIGVYRISDNPLLNETYDPKIVSGLFSKETAKMIVDLVK